MEDRISGPVFFQFLYRKPFEKLALPFEIRLHRRHKKAFPETTRPAEKIVFPCREKVIYLPGLVYIDISSSPEVFKILDTYRIQHG